MRRENDNFTIIKSIYEDTNVEIFFPQFINVFEENKENRINSLISDQDMDLQYLLVENLKGDFFDMSNHYVEWYIEGEKFVFVSLFGGAYEEYSIDIESLKNIINESRRRGPHEKVLFCIRAFGRCE